MSLTDAIGPHDARPVRLPNGYPSMDGPTGEAEYGTAAAAANRQLLAQALTDAGVELYAFDRAVLDLLAASDPGVARVIAGWLVRARLGGLQDAASTAASTASSFTSSGLVYLLGSLLRVAADNKATGAQAVATTISSTLAALTSTWTTR